MNQKESFNYTYSAEQQAEVESIREKYLPKTEDKMDLLRKLDAEVTKKASIKSMTIGIIGALILGFGMSIFMSDFGKILGLAGVKGMIIGIIIGIIGIVGVVLAYPIYQNTLKKEREKIAPEILRLSEELTK